MWRVDRLADDPARKDGGIRPWKAGPDDVQAIAWDGEHIRAFTSRSNFGEIRNRSDINSGHTGGPLFHELFATTIFGGAYLKAIQPRKSIGVERRSSDELVLDCPPAKGALVSFNGNRLVIILDPNKGWAVKKIWCSSSAHTDRPVWEIENSLGEFSPGLWLPTKAAKRVYRRVSGDEAPELFGEQLIEVDAVRAFVNVEIAPDVFRLKFPQGAIVYDKTEHKNFLAAAGDGRDYAGYDRMARSKVGRVSARTEGPSGPMFAFLVALTAIVVALAAWRLRRRHGA